MAKTVNKNTKSGVKTLKIILEKYSYTNTIFHKKKKQEGLNLKSWKYGNYKISFGYFVYKGDDMLCYYKYF